MREFSKEGAFTNPSESLKIPQWSCPECTLARDWDLCRDESLLPDLGETEADIRKAAAVKVWRCQFCDAELERLRIEEKLLADVQAMVVEWTTQDLKCERCGSVRLNDLMEHCTCSGPWIESVKRDEVVRKLGVHQGIAKWYGLRMLESLVTEVLGGL